MSYNIKHENCLKELTIRYKTLGPSIIKYVAEKHDYDVLKANSALMELTGAIVSKRKHDRLPRIPNSDQYLSIEEIEGCIDDVIDGGRVLIIMRGLPGSGKSHLAKSILDACYPNPNYTDHIHSADNFFMVRGKYNFVPNQLSEAHQWNQNSVNLKMKRGFSPIIVDNTNVRMWEMSAYTNMAVKNGYKIRIIEMNTTWCFNCNELTRRNKHNVPKYSIKNMLERYEMGITAEELLKFCKCPSTYQTNPILRQCPPLSPKNLYPTNSDLFLPRSKKKTSDLDDFGELYWNTNEGAAGIKNTTKTNENGTNDLVRQFSSLSFKWNTEIGSSIKSWNSLDSFTRESNSEEVAKKPELKEIGVNTSMLDFQDRGSKVIHGRCRDINNFYKSVVDNKPGMLNKGCCTNEHECPNRNEDLKKLIDIFQNVPPVYIRDMYDDCKGDFDMTFEIFLEDNKDYSHLPFGLDNVITNTNEVEEKSVQSQLTKVQSEESLDEASILPKATPKKFKRSQSLEKLLFGPSPSTGAIKKNSKCNGKPRNKSECLDTISDNEYLETCSDSDSDFNSQSSGSPSENDNVEINLGSFLVKQLEKEFGEPTHNFPDGFQPVVQVPKNMARQLYAFYVESIYQQMDAQKSILDQLVKEDEAFARKLYEEENLMVQKPIEEDFQDIMKEQAALKKHRMQMPELKTPNDIATLLTKKKLFQSFPNVEESVILELYHANSLNYKQTVDDLIASVGRVDDGKNVREPPITKKTLQELEQAQKDSSLKVEEDEEKSPQDYREEADYYLKKRNELYQKAQEYYSRGQMEVAQFYSQLAQQQTKYYDMANNKAATVFLETNSKHLQDSNTLDLHYLFVKEAVAALDVFIDNQISMLNSSKNKFSQDLLIITGRGKRSANGVSRIRPAVIRRLEARKIKYHKMNPGLLKIKIRLDTPVTNNL